MYKYHACQKYQIPLKLSPSALFKKGLVFTMTFERAPQLPNNYQVTDQKHSKQGGQKYYLIANYKKRYERCG